MSVEVKRPKVLPHSVIGMTLVGLAALTVAACSGGGGGGEANSLRVAVTSAADTGDIVAVTAPIEFGEKFGITGSADDIKRFDSHATAAQVMMSGRADVLAGSFASSLALIEKTPEVRVYCPMQAATAEMLVGVDDVDSLDDLRDPSSMIAIDSPGGAADSFLNTLLQTKKAGFTVNDIPSKLILEDGGQRLTAVQTGEAKVTIMDGTELAVLRTAIDPNRIHVISVLAEDIGDTAVYQAFAAKKEWLDANKELAAKQCASVVEAARTLSADIDALQTVADNYIEPNPKREDLQSYIDLSAEHTVWPTSPLITEEQFTANMESALASGVISQPLAYNDVIDVAVMEEAEKLLNGEQN